MMESRNYDTFVRATAFMMTVGGPRGRDAMLAVPIQTFDAKSRQYYAEVRRDIEATTYVALQKQFEGFPGSGGMSDTDIKNALSVMYRNYSARTIDQSSRDSGIWFAEDLLDDRAFPRSIQNVLSRLGRGAWRCEGNQCAP